MATSSKLGIPEGYQTVTPFVIVKGAAKFIDFMKQAFNAEETVRVAGEDGSIGHAEVKIGGSVVMLFDSKKDWPQTRAFLRVYVNDVDKACAEALKAGGTLVTKLTDMPWGDRCCRVCDPFGNLWWIMTRIENVSPEEEGKRYGQQKYIDALTYFQSTDFFKFIQKQN